MLERMRMEEVLKTEFVWHLRLKQYNRNGQKTCRLFVFRPQTGQMEVEKNLYSSPKEKELI
jgi:hypothetical protein